MKFSAQHYDQEDIYRHTWRRARAEAIAGSISPQVLSASLRPSRSASNESTASEVMTVASIRGKSGGAFVNGFSSFV